MKDGRNENFIMIPLEYAESQYSLFANREMTTETLADLISYADSHDLCWEYVDLGPSHRKGWKMWDNHNCIHSFKSGCGILKVLKKHNLGVRKNLFGNLVLCEV